MGKEIYLGIDPGKSGGMAALVGRGIMFTKMPEDCFGILSWLGVIGDMALEEGVPLFAHIEKVGGYIGKGQPGSAMFSFGMGYGQLLMALAALKIPHEEIPPQRWQKGLRIPGRGKAETKTAWKNRLRTHAQKIYPKSKVTLAFSDALLIATYCQRKREGTL